MICHLILQIERITEGNQRPDLARVASIARRFAEWKMARTVVENELYRGDMLVIDGSLQEAFQNETKYTRELHQLCESKGVILCGLSKTSRLYTDSGVSLLGAIKQISNLVNFGTWFIKIGTQQREGFNFCCKITSKFRICF